MVDATRGLASRASMLVYIANAESNEIYVMRLDSGSGTATLEQTVSVPGAVGPLAVSPNRRFLYASLRSTPFSVSNLAIDPATGRLRLLSTVPLPDNMTYLSVDKMGRFLFGASYSGNRISINPIDSGGLVDARPVQVVPTAPRPHSIVADLGNHHLFVPSLGGDCILQFKLDQTTGRVTPNVPASAETRTGAGPRHIVFHSSHRFLYCTNELDATVGGYRYDETAGTLAPLGTETLLPRAFCGRPPYAAADIHTTPDGRFLYASERASNTIAGFAVNGQTGALAPIGTFPTELHPRGFNIDPLGRFLLAVGQKSNSMSLYAIYSDGTLALRHRYPMGQAPNWVEIVELA
jgi:6-phosphogluconolactonase